MGSSGLRVAVVDHVEWVLFAHVDHVPSAGEVVHASEPFEEPAGGGAVAAVQLARLADESVLVTVLGDDEHGRRSRERLRGLGVDVKAAVAAAPTRRAVTLLDAHGERTITTFGARLDPRGHDAAAALGGAGSVDALYFTAGDLAALRAAREAARVLVASPRARDALGHGVPLDALVLSGSDEIERRGLARAEDEAEVVLSTEGERGGSYRTRAGSSGRWSAVAPPGELVDSYGPGDSFAAGLAYGLGAGLGLERALEVGARCGATCVAGRGPYGRQLSGRELSSET